MQRGIKDIVENAEKESQEFIKNRINFISLGDKELVELRFLTDSDDLIKARIHSIQENTPKGPRFVKKYCTMQDIGSCTYCSNGDKVQSFIYLWSWVYTFFHVQQNPKLGTYKDAQKWEPIKLADGKTYYKAIINGPMVFKITVGQKGMYQNTIIGFARDYGSLTDRTYRISRNGTSLDTVYTITPLKESPIPDDLKECMANLPDLGDVITGKIRSFNKSEVEEVIPEDLPEGDDDHQENTKDIF